MDKNKQYSEEQWQAWDSIADAHYLQCVHRWHSSPQPYRVLASSSESTYRISIERKSYVIEDGELVGVSVTCGSKSDVLYFADAENQTFSVVEGDGLEYDAHRYTLMKKTEDERKKIVRVDGVSTVDSSTVGMYSYAEEIYVAEGVTAIAENAFASMIYLRHVHLPSSLSIIGKRAFAGCTNLESIDIPSGVTVLEEYLFSNCLGLKRVALPDSVHTIKEGAFLYCTHLEEINFPLSLESIGKKSFADCGALRAIALPKNLRSIGPHCFDAATGLEELNLEGSSIEVIPANAFRSCISLERISLPKSVQKIEAGAFYNCTHLQIDTLPPNISYIGDCAFQDCLGGESLTIPHHLSYLGSHAFFGWALLKELHFSGADQASTTAFARCPLLETVYVEDLALYTQTEFQLDTTSYFFGTAPFGSLKRFFVNGVLLESLVIPEGVEQIGAMTFYGIESLKEVKISNEVAVIGEEAFANCKNLRSVFFGKGVTCIYNNAFEGCESFTEFEVARGNSKIKRMIASLIKKNQL